MKMHVRMTCFVLIVICSLCNILACRRNEAQNEIVVSSYSMMLPSPTTIFTNQILSDGTHATKTIFLNGVQITDTFLQKKHELSLVSQLSAELNYSAGINPFEESDGAVDLGMENVPVLDQGAYGTCVTFATTAILDAILGEGDLISQQCILALNKELGNNYWNGAQHSLQILRPLRTYGVVEQNKCTSTYPNNLMKLNKSEYTKMTSKNFNVISVTGHFIEPITLDFIKSALDKNHRVALGFGIAQDYTGIPVSGFDMHIKNKRTTGGLWACKQPDSAVNYCSTPNSGHEVVVIGYDDNQQLLKIRNSWGNGVGDDGDYYMTYQFFQAMSFNGTELFKQ